MKKQIIKTLLVLILIVTAIMPKTNFTRKVSALGGWDEPCEHNQHHDPRTGVCVFNTEEDKQAYEEAEKRWKEEERRRSEEMKAKAEAERKAQEEAAKQAEQERIAKEQAEAERKAQEEAARKAELAEKYAKMKNEGSLKSESKKLETPESKPEKDEAAKKAEQERLAKEKAESESDSNKDTVDYSWVSELDPNAGWNKRYTPQTPKAEKDEATKKAETEANAKEEAVKKAEQERIAKEKAEAEKKAKEEAAKKAEAEKKAKEEAAKKAEAERLAKEKAEQEKSEKEKQEQKTEIIRQEIAKNAIDITLEGAYSHSSPANRKKAVSIDQVDVYTSLSGAESENYYQMAREAEELVYQKLNEMRKEAGLNELNKTKLGADSWSQIMMTTGLYEHANLSDKEYGLPGLGLAKENNYRVSNIKKVGYDGDIYYSGAENINLLQTNSKLTAKTIANKLTKSWNNSNGHYQNRFGNYQNYEISIKCSSKGCWATERLTGENKK